MPQLVAENLHFIWPDGKGFTDLNFQVESGDFTLIHGPSGMGKSTLLRLIVRLEELQKGHILLNGNDIAEIKADYLRQKIALVTQTPQMLQGTVKEALELPFSFISNAQRKKPSDVDLQNYMAALHLDMPLTAQTSTLSLGQQQRVALIRHMLLKPEILLLDEPTSALDAESRLAVEQCIEAANEAGTTILMITHTDYTPARPRTLWTIGQGGLRIASGIQSSLQEHKQQEVA